MLVVDASLVLEWCLAPDGADLPQLLGDELSAPPLLWSETLSALRARVWRREIGDAEADVARARLGRLGARRARHPRLLGEAWRIAGELGWARTYDAEYVALASLLGCRLVTVDARLRRGADRLGFVVGPTEL